METSELIEIISRGEDSRNQFKENIHNELSLAQEMVAFSNSRGGRIFVGVDDSWSVGGLTADDVRRLDTLISNAASQCVRPAINPQTENIAHPDGLVSVIAVPEGMAKPYMDKNGAIWVKSGSAKRKATSREEIQRMFQAAGLIHGDTTPANGLTVSDIDRAYFDDFVQREYGIPPDIKETSLPLLLENMNLMVSSTLNIAGALLFARAPQFRLPAHIVKAVAYPGDIPDESRYLDSRDIEGKIADMFRQSIAFLVSNIPHTQGGKGINSTADPVVPGIVFEELIANALIHRDYFVTAPVRVCVFSNRIEIVSPGSLPNNLTVENIKAGNSNIRNPTLASFATKLMDYRGLGTGIRRALQAYPWIDVCR